MLSDAFTLWGRGSRAAALWALAGLSGFAGPAATAQTVRQRPFFSASRALTMGDAFTAYGQGFESVYYNPAGVARKGKVQVKYFDFELNASYPVYTYLSGNLLSFYRLDQLATNMAANPDRVHAMGLTIAPQLLTKNFSLGLLMRGYWEGLVDGATSNFDFYGYTDMALYLHYGVSFFGGVLKMGVGGKALDRAEVNRVFTPSEYSSGQLSFTTQWQEGVGYGLDLGLLVTSPTAGLPAFGLVVQDFSGTELLDRRFIWTGERGAAGSPATLRQKVNTGVNFTLKHSPGVKSNVAFDVKDVLNLSGSNYLERLHFGWELDYEKFFVARAGVNQGKYWTAGIGLKLARIQLELGTWGENLLVYTGSTRSTRIYMGRYVLSF